MSVCAVGMGFFTNIILFDCNSHSRRQKEYWWGRGWEGGSINTMSVLYIASLPASNCGSNFTLFYEIKATLKKKIVFNLHRILRVILVLNMQLDINYLPHKISKKKKKKVNRLEIKIPRPQSDIWCLYLTV